MLSRSCPEDPPRYNSCTEGHQGEAMAQHLPQGELVSESGESSSPWPLALAVLTPAALWAALFLLFLPGQQNFPLNDDCQYSKTAFGLAHGDGLNYYNQA